MADEHYDWNIRDSSEKTTRTILLKACFARKPGALR